MCTQHHVSLIICYYSFLFVALTLFYFRTPLHAAAFSGHVDCVQLLLSHDAPVDAVDQSGRTALMMVAEKGGVGVLGTYCIAKHFSLCVSDFICILYVFVAFIMSCPLEVLLTSAKANLSLRDKDDNTALHLACSNVSVHQGGLLCLFQSS